MTLEELTRIKDQLSWARTKCLTGGMFDGIVLSLRVIEREINLKTMDPRKSEKNKSPGEQDYDY